MKMTQWELNQPERQDNTILATAVRLFHIVLERLIEDISLGEGRSEEVRTASVCTNLHFRFFRISMNESELNVVRKRLNHGEKQHLFIEMFSYMRKLTVFYLNVR